jgi:uncharacterized protein
LAASGGIVAALIMAASGVRPEVLRATMVNSLLWMSAYTLAWGVFFSQVSDASNVLIAEQF